MNALLRSGKELRVFDLKEQDLAAFRREAKKYGILFSVIKDTASGSGHVDILAKAEDVSKLNRVFERMHYAAPEKQQAEDEPLKKSRVPCSAREQIRRARDWLAARDDGE